MVRNLSLELLTNHASRHHSDLRPARGPRSRRDHAYIDLHATDPTCRTSVRATPRRRARRAASRLAQLPRSPMPSQYQAAQAQFLPPVPDPRKIFASA